MDGKYCKPDVLHALPLSSPVPQEKGWSLISLQDSHDQSLVSSILKTVDVLLVNMLAL